MAVETLARAAPAPLLAQAFREVFITCGLVLGAGMGFLLAMEERPLRGPIAHHAAEEAPTGPATAIPEDGLSSLH